jgi:quercetin dioxygenase-like cupin family protein
MSVKDEMANPTSNEIVRRHLLTATLDGQKTVNRVEIKEITLAARQRTGLHLHPCPVVGYITEGTILFQIDGEAERVLKPGDAFFEPAQTRVVHFDNATDEPAKFIAYYLVGTDDRELITMLPVV